MFLTGVALKMHQAYLKNPQDIWDLSKKGLPFSKTTYNLLKTYYHFLKTYYNLL